ncbi:MAG: hypothetical protein NVSMB52_20260 [Chloroflexota bacterium]
MQPHSYLQRKLTRRVNFVSWHGSATSWKEASSLYSRQTEWKLELPAVGVQIYDCYE